jgi:hypothetical protein
MITSKAAGAGNFAHTVCASDLSVDLTHGSLMGITYA